MTRGGVKRALSAWAKIALVLALSLVVLVAIESQTKFLHRLFDDYLSVRHHYLSCDQLPEVAEVNRIVAQHQSTIDQIKRVHPGQVGVYVNTLICPGKADLIIWYATRDDMKAIEKIINGLTFFGVPYQLQNV